MLPPGLLYRRGCAAALVRACGRSWLGGVRRKDISLRRHVVRRARRLNKVRVRQMDGPARRGRAREVSVTPSAPTGGRTDGRAGISLYALRLRRNATQRSATHRADRDPRPPPAVRRCTSLLAAVGKIEVRFRSFGRTAPCPAGEQGDAATRRRSAVTKRDSLQPRMMPRLGGGGRVNEGERADQLPEFRLVSKSVRCAQQLANVNANADAAVGPTHSFGELGRKSKPRAYVRTDGDGHVLRPGPGLAC